jgi:hypothetical protein
VSTDELVLRVAALKAIKDFTEAEYDKARGEMAAAMNPGDRLTARSPLDGSKLGAVSMTDPKVTSRVADQAALTDWLFEHYPATVTVGYEVSATDEELRRVLFEHAPHLLRKVRRVDPETVRELRANAVALGAPVGPGGEADVPGLVVESASPTVRCNSTDTALPAVMELIRAERMGIDGVIRRQLTPEEQA